MKIIGAEGDEAYQELSNEAGRRVWTVMQNLMEVRARGSGGIVGDLDVKAILMGAITGIASHVARMDLKVENPTPDAQPPEVLILNDLGNQFLHAIEQHRATDPIAKLMSAGADSERAS